MTAFDTFASHFVRCYWQTVKSEAFPMSPFEPVEESLEELISAVSFEASISPKDGSGAIVMRSKHGDSWNFAFLKGPHGWQAISCFVPSGDPGATHDLLGPVYGQYFGPFLRHVCECANFPEEPNQPSQPTPVNRRG
jgi:hypothetical protein